MTHFGQVKFADVLQQVGQSQFVDFKVEIYGNADKPGKMIETTNSVGGKQSSSAVVVAMLISFRYSALNKIS